VRHGAPVEARFWAKVNKDGPGGCWIWTGTLVRGYGQTSIRGRERIYTHRLSWELHRGPIPDGLTIDHLCRVRACCNPDHLEPVTNAENLRRGAATRPRRTQCPQGHQVPEGTRQCIRCKQLWEAKFRKQKGRRVPRT
jgi:HNH endonuclease